MIGGAVTFVNPEPLALFADIIAAGEGEALIPPLVHAFRDASDRDDMLRRLVAERGFYVPSFYDVRYADDGTIEGFVVKEGTTAPRRRAESRTADDRRGRPARHEDLHARNRVRLEVPDRSRARVREPLSLLLGGLQLPSRARLSRRIGSSSSRSGRGNTRIASDWCRSRCATTRRSKRS